jgi:hypothetical protein
MFYWSVNYLFYSITKSVSQSLLPANVDVVNVAQKHGEDILYFEHASIFSFLFPIQESAFQSYFILNHPSLMTVFNRIYSLVHIPGTVLYVVELFLIDYNLITYVQTDFFHGIITKHQTRKSLPWLDGP